jgi:cytoskeletal protein RodZ
MISVMQAIDQKADTTYVNTQLATKANSSSLSNYYLKTETDNKLNLKADSSTTYTKSDTDNLLTNYYNKTQNDTQLNLKADKIYYLYKVRS